MDTDGHYVAAEDWLRIAEDQHPDGNEAAVIALAHAVLATLGREG